MEAVTKKDQKLAINSYSSLSITSKKILQASTGGIQIKIQEADEFVTIPKKALSLLIDILSNMAEGKSITLIASDVEVSTQQAANTLNISRPHLVKLLEQGEIPHRKVGRHRRIQLEDLMEYKNKLKKNRRKNLDFLAEQAQDLNLGY